MTGYDDAHMPWLNRSLEEQMARPLRRARFLGQIRSETVIYEGRRRQDLDPELHPGLPPCEATDPATCGVYVEGTDA
jgi:hypothetical protein